jgi:hypothetical protein
VARQERNWFMPKMYYIAVMDCDDEIHDALGDSIEHRLEILMTLKADQHHFSYDKQGEHELNVFLLILFTALIVLFGRDF